MHRLSNLKRVYNKLNEALNTKSFEIIHTMYGIRLCYLFYALSSM